MLCPSCSSQNVFLEDGQFFCSGCYSQQLAAREETIVEETLNISRKNIVGSTTTDESSLDASVSRFGSEPSSIYECYNVLLYKQVSALIHLGVSEKLKDVVLFIWSKYLQKCEAAFNEGNAPVQEKIKDIESNSNPSIPHDPPCVKKRKTKKRNKNQDNNVLNSDSDAGVSRNDSMEVDEPSGAAFFSQSKNFWSHYELFAMRTDRVDKMCISKTLCFCYLGLLYIQDRLLLTDLLRLVQEERVPYLNAINYIPYTMLSSFPSMLFNEKHIPDVNYIVRRCSQLIRFLQLPKFKHRSLIPIALTFVKDLNLPDNIIHVVKMLVDKCNERTKHWTTGTSAYSVLVPMYEVQAIALIIVALKMFYVLDGEYEVNHCDIARKINIVLQDRRLFVWDQWKKQATLKEYLFFKPNSRCNKISLFDSLSATQIISKYSGPDYVPIVSIDPAAHRRRNSAKQTILTVFNSLRSGKEAIPETPAPTSFPLTQNLSNFMENWKNLRMYKETEEIDFSLLTENFSSDILFYKPSTSEDESSKEIIELLCGSLYKPVPYMDGTVPDAFQTSSNYWQKVPEKNGWNKLLEDSSPSFQWLLKFMSKYINTDCLIVYQEVYRLEIKILPPRHKMRELY